MAELFEQEVAMEQKSSWGPLLLVLALVASIVGGIGYYVFQMKKGLSQEEATAIVTEQLKSKGVSIHFHTGRVVSGLDEQAKDPHYKLLAKAGYVDVKDLSWNTITAALTPAGQKELSSIPGYKTWPNTDKTVSVEVPIASRQLVKIESIELQGPSAAKVQYTWQWNTNRVGDLFEASSQTVKNFNTWDRQKLIDKYGVNFYHESPKKEVVRLLKDDKGWKLANE